MIAILEGKIIGIEDQSIILSVQGIGFGIFVIQSSLFELNQSIRIYTFMHWHQEQGPQLFGFMHQYEKIIFRLLISCPGIGPKLALAMLAHTSSELLMHAIFQGESATLSTIPGIGKKKAEQVILFLKDKVEKIMQQGLVPVGEHISDLQKISDVLASLDYSKQEISAALNFIKRDPSHLGAFDNKLRKALSYLNKRAS